VLSKLDLVKPILIAFVPTALWGLMAYKFIKGYLLGNTAVTVWALLLGGIFMIWYERKIHNKEGKLKIEDLDCKKSLMIGLVQSVDDSGSIQGDGDDFRRNGGGTVPGGSDEV
jgi:undecaprenyl-diphosphatase